MILRLWKLISFSDCHCVEIDHKVGWRSPHAADRTQLFEGIACRYVWFGMLVSCIIYVLICCFSKWDLFVCGWCLFWQISHHGIHLFGSVGTLISMYIQNTSQPLISRFDKHFLVFYRSYRRNQKHLLRLWWLRSFHLVPVSFGKYFCP